MWFLTTRDIVLHNIHHRWWCACHFQRAPVQHCQNMSQTGDDSWWSRQITLLVVHHHWWYVCHFQRAQPVSVRCRQDTSLTAKGMIVGSLLLWYLALKWVILRSSLSCKTIPTSLSSANKMSSEMVWTCSKSTCVDNAPGIGYAG
jgi:hypothetical protein